MKPIRYFLVLASLAFIGTPSAFADQSSSDIQQVNRIIIKKLLESITVQKSEPVELGLARAQIEPLLDWRDPKLAEHLLGLAEVTNSEKVKFLILGSLGAVGQLEDPSAFNRLLDFFENPATSSSDRTSASNSWREAGIHSGNQNLLSNLARRAQDTKDQIILNEYIFFLGLESRNLKGTGWYFRFLVKNLEDQSLPPQLRATAAYAIGSALAFGHTETVEQKTFLQDSLIHAAIVEPSSEAQVRIILAMEMAPDPSYQRILLDFQRNGGESGAAATRALFALRGGFTASNVISLGQRFKNGRAHILDLWTRAKTACSILGD